MVDLFIDSDSKYQAHTQTYYIAHAIEGYIFCNDLTFWRVPHIF